MMPSYKKMRETFDKAWKMTRAPFERIQVNYEGTMLDGYFRKPDGPAGKRFPVMIAFQGGAEQRFRRHEQHHVIQ